MALKIKSTSGVNDTNLAADKLGIRYSKKNNNLS